jgi:UDP-N-acetylglucosamine 2-epimerase (non-hydrolysing)/GDP/UDP-N,N'-diacetylbacillosamine 2-epimerase (hydrolysing)
MSELLAALEMSNLPVVFTSPNADTHGRNLIRMIDDYVNSHSIAQKVDTFGTLGYFSMMKIARAMVGNSSSGIIEAASFELPVVNIGNRQKGRTHGINVIHAEYDRVSILKGIRRAVSDEFRQLLLNMRNPYAANTNAAQIIVDTLKRAPLAESLIVKRFCDFANPVL